MGVVVHVPGDTDIWVSDDRSVGVVGPWAWWGRGRGAAVGVVRRYPPG